jgi:putative Holliday junction resolvase
MHRNDKALAIDLGRARMGLAISDPGSNMALPHSVVERKGTRLDLQVLLPLLDRLGVQVVILGLPPESPDGAGTHRLARNFALALAKAQPRPVVLVDEADTTTEAHAELRLLGMRASKRRAEVDKHAAARILDRWLGGAPVEQVLP